MSPDYQPPNYPSGPEARPEERVEAQRSQHAEIWRGIGLASLLHLIQIPLIFVTYFFSLMFIGISQLLYIVPAIVIYQRKGRPGVVIGLIIAAAITFLLNGTCTVIFFIYLSNHH